MGNRQFRRLEDFYRADADVMARCSNCGHDGQIDSYALFRWFGIHCWNNSVEEIPKRLRCSVCRRRPTAIIPVPKTDKRPFDHFFPRTEDGWKRKVRSLRG